MMQKESKHRRSLIKGIRNISFLFSYIEVMFFTVLLLAACKKEGQITVTTDSITGITESEAKTGGSVSYTGGFYITECGVCYSESYDPTIYDDHTEDHYGVGMFSSLLKNLKSGTKYYVRAYAQTSSGIIYGNQESFTTEGGWLYYGNGTYKNSWGLINGGSLTWACMFPTNMLSSYGGSIIKKIKFYVGLTGNYTIDIYQGGNTSPTTLLSSKMIYATVGWNTWEVSPTIYLSSSQTLWVAITTTHTEGQYPASCSEGINNVNARWRCFNGTWANDTENGWEDVCWLIQACLTKNDYKSGDEYTIMLSGDSEKHETKTIIHDGYLKDPTQLVAKESVQTKK